MSPQTQTKNEQVVCNIATKGTEEHSDELTNSFKKIKKAFVTGGRGPQ